MWQRLRRHHSLRWRGAKTLATIALLKKKPVIAATLADMLNAPDMRLSNATMRDETGQFFHAAAFMKLTLQLHGADFHIDPSLFIVTSSLGETE